VHWVCVQVSDARMACVLGGMVLQEGALGLCAGE
jgi:hypothetical protein